MIVFPCSFAWEHSVIRHKLTPVRSHFFHTQASFRRALLSTILQIHQQPLLPQILPQHWEKIIKIQFQAVLLNSVVLSAVSPCHERSRFRVQLSCFCNFPTTSHSSRWYTFEMPLIIPLFFRQIPCECFLLGKEKGLCENSHFWFASRW